MSKIVKSQYFLCKQRIIPICIFLISALLIYFVGLSACESIPRAFSQSGLMAMFLILMIPVMIIAFSYIGRIQIYEIMSGYKVHQIILGKTMVFLPFTIIFLVVATMICLIFDSDAEIMCRLILYWVICIRATLCIVFLSPLLKEGTFAPMFSVMLLAIYDSNTEALSRSPFSFIGFAQCALLGGDLTNVFMVKVIVSSVVACVICYLIGYVTLKNKFDLEPHPLT